MSGDRGVCSPSPPPSTAGEGVLPTQTPPATTPARVSEPTEQRRALSFRPPFRRLSGLSSSKKVHAAFKSPLRTPDTPPADSVVSNTDPATTSSGSSSTQSVKPQRSQLTASNRHTPYSLKHRTHTSRSNTACAAETEETDIASLRERVEAAQRELDELSKEYSEDEYQQYIDDLHEYNEVKDAAQMLLGKLAEVRCTTVSELYKQFDLDLDD